MKSGCILPHGLAKRLSIVPDIMLQCMSLAFVEGFGCRPMAMKRLAPGPASESLQ